ncbi:hypothetical protein QXK92_33910, partial [Mycobacterium sp. TY815]|nr:hypothetical protein [Mycobacterium sp. TY815]
YDRLKALLDRGQPLSRADWTRTLLATEVCFASSVLGAGLEWEAIAGDDVFTLGVLRLLQRKLWKAGALAPQGGPRYEPPVNLKFEASPWPIDSTAQQPASPTWVASVTTPCHYTIAIPAGTTGIAMALIGGGGGGGAYLANGHSRFVPRGSCGESTTAKLPLGGLAGIKHCAAGGYGGITTDYAHLRHPSLTAGQSTDDVTPHMFPRGFVIRGGRGGAAGNDSPGGDGPAPGAGGGPGARLRPDGRPYGSYGGSGGFSGEYQSRVVWLPAKSTEADGLQITGFVGAGGAGDPGRDRDDGAFAGGNGGDGAAYFAFLSDPPPTQAVHASPEVSKPSPSQANSPPVQLPRFEIEPLPIRRAEFKLPRMLKRWRR